MTIDYKQLRALVKEAMTTQDSINELGNSGPVSGPAGKEQDMGDPQANEMYDVALAAREATEKLVAALEDPTFDAAYEYAFKASACLRNALNSLEESGAHPMPIQRVVAPPVNQQKYSSGGGGDYAGGVPLGGFVGGVLDEETDTGENLGVKNPTLQKMLDDYHTYTDEDKKALKAALAMTAAGEDK
tara:strand:+ start:287 stop:847 length:561 start_codon:yes stop_codon:yes gene_type:complete